VPSSTKWSVPLLWAPTITAVFMMNGGLFADAHSHPWQGTAMLRSPLYAFATKGMQRRVLPKVQRIPVLAWNADSISQDRRSSLKSGQPSRAVTVALYVGGSEEDPGRSHDYERAPGATCLCDSGHCNATRSRTSHIVQLDVTTADVGSVASIAYLATCDLDGPKQGLRTGLLCESMPSSREEREVLFSHQIVT